MKASFNYSSYTRGCADSNMTSILYYVLIFRALRRETKSIKREYHHGNLVHERDNIWAWIPQGKYYRKIIKLCNEIFFV